ncbi:MAG TPA: sodium:calcium antiporter [Acidobacteriota bacterium]|nr:sodium:calcium antiporter [Acidobacteriota bacterium]
MEHLIGPETFTPLSSWILILVLIASIFFLVKAADLLVEGASGLAYRLGIPQVIVGATVISLGTTTPECAVSVMAAWSGNSGLALGNAVGSVIADTGLIFGLGCLIKHLTADRFVLNRQGWIQVSVAVLLALLCYGTWIMNGEYAALGRPVGLLLLLLLAGYLCVSVRWARNHPQGMRGVVPEAMAGKAPGLPDTKEVARRERPIWLLARILSGLIIVIFASHILILAVSELVLRWGVPQVVVASTIVALGTSTPELVIGLASVFKGHDEILVGNVIGADILNILFVTGASAVASPLFMFDQQAQVPAIFLILHLPVMLLILGIFRLCIFDASKRGRFSRWMGIPLLTVYVVYSVLQYVVS